jgi:hypothetical protein
MSNLKQSMSKAMDNLPAIFMYTGSDGAEYSEDPNLKDIYHLAETIRDVCKLNIGDTASNQSLSKEQVIEIVELVESELLSHPAVKPILRDPLISDPHAIRVKDDNQLIEEFDKLGMEVLKKYPQIASTTEEAIMKSLFMWHGCLNIGKQCRLQDVHNMDPQNRMQVHDWLVSQSNSNPWIRRGFTSAKYFRPEQKGSKDYSWIPHDSLYWQA